MELLGEFHFIRPLWLLALLPVLVSWWPTRRRLGGDAEVEASSFAPHLLEALRVGRTKRRGILPIDLSSATAAVMILAAAGPTVEREPNPLLTESASLVIALGLDETMLANDLQPSRLERARHKILDLVEQRGDGRTALIAYANSAHLVLPPTDDPRIVKTFLESLSPGIMPEAGSNAAAALELAGELLERDEMPGSVLFVNDGFPALDIAAFESFAATPDAPAVLALVLATTEGGTARYADRSLVRAGDGRALDTALDERLLDRFASQAGVLVNRYTIDDVDIRNVQDQVSSELRRALNNDETMAWKDLGWWLTLPLLLMVLYSFRRGWTMPWCLVFGLGLLQAPGSANAGPLDWFVSPDQQGRYAFEQLDFSRAADLFVDPMWRGIAAYRAGRYEDAIDAFSRVRSAEGFFNLGNAYVKNHRYDLAIEAFEEAVALAPEGQAAQRNLDVSRHIQSYLTQLRLDTDTGDETELGADEFRFDNKTGEGKEIVITNESRLEAKTAEQWLRAVDTDTAEYLRTKFALEASMSSP